MRIISGKYKGRVLKGFNIDGTRPTMDRVKESLFAMIGKEVKTSICLDLYAGSGSLGIEALSNGALSCMFVDKNKIAIDTIKENTKMIDGVKILQSDAFKIHQKVTETYNLVFLDPPYHLHLIGKTLSYLIEKKLLKEGAIIICEYEEEAFSNDNFEVLKERKYGSKWVKVLKYQKK